METKFEFEYLIIGAGPAGVQLGYHLEQAGRDYLILEGSDSPGAFFQRFPRHRTLISTNKVYTGYEDPEINLRWDWNSILSHDEKLRFKEYSKRYFPGADDFVDYLRDYVTYYELKIRYETQVVRIRKNGSFSVWDSEGNVYGCQRLIIATGVSKPYIPDIPGIELAENYTTVSVDPKDFINQRVLILGKGNSAFETADNLIETTALVHVSSPNPIKMAWQTHFVGNLRAVNNNILDTYQLKSQNAILDATVDKIVRKDDKFIVSVSYAHAHGEQEDLVYDRIIACTGFRFDDSFFEENCKPELVINDRFPKQTSAWESTNIEGLYFAGALTQMRDYRKSTSAFIHGFRYNVLALHRILEQRYHQQAWPSTTIDHSPQGITDAVIQRVNQTSALWQQFGFLCDLIVVPDDSDQAHYYPEVPVDYIRDTDFGQHAHYYLITLEYGPNHDAADPFNVTRIQREDVARADQSNFLHPVIRRFEKDKLVAEHHIIEDLEAEWFEPEHIDPLHAFFTEQLAETAAQKERVYA